MARRVPHTDPESRILFGNYWKLLYICPSIYQSVGVRACESAIAHVRAEIQVRKGCEASWNCACEVRACGGIYGVRLQVRSHLKFYQ